MTQPVAALVNLAEFNKAIRNFVDVLVPEQAEKFIRGVAMLVLRFLVKNTPSGKPWLWKNPKSAPAGYTGGRAKANWQVNVGSITSGTVDDIDPEGTMTISKAEGILRDLPNKGIGSVIFCFNNLPYIVPLEEGHSEKQAPQGIISVTLADVLARIPRRK